jgi:hypothetical protein
MKRGAGTLAVVSLVALSGCTGAAPPSGIEGSVWLGPNCPVARDPPEPGCEDRPYATRLQALEAGLTRVRAEFASGSDGRFRVDLAAGTYEIRRAPDDKPFPTCAVPEPVVVRGGAYSTVRVDCDTGIR